MTETILALMARIVEPLFFDSVLISLINIFKIYFIVSFFMFLEELLLFLFTFFFNYKVKGENGLNHNNSNHYIDGDQLGALHWHGRVTELNHM